MTTESYSKDLGIGAIQLVFETKEQIVPMELNIYPNPTSGLLNIAFANEKQENVQLALYNLTGQLVKEWTNITDNQVQLDLSKEINGTYLLMLKRADGVEVKRLVLNH